MFGASVSIRPSCHPAPSTHTGLLVSRAACARNHGRSHQLAGIVCGTGAGRRGAALPPSNDRRYAPFNRGGTSPWCRVTTPSCSSSVRKLRKEELHVPSCCAERKSREQARARRRRRHAVDATRRAGHLTSSTKTWYPPACWAAPASAHTRSTSRKPSSLAIRFTFSATSSASGRRDAAATGGCISMWLLGAGCASEPQTELGNSDVNMIQSQNRLHEPFPRTW